MKKQSMKAFRKITSLVGGLLAVCAVFHVTSAGAQALILNTNQGSTVYSQNFDGLGTAFPTEWSYYKSATATSLGTAVTPSAAQLAWSQTSFLFGNFASTTNNSGTPFVGTEVAATQNAASNRSLAVRTTSATGSDPGTAFVLEIDNTTNLVNFKLDLDFNLLSPQGRTTIWTVDYGFGSSPTSFTVADATKNFTAAASPTGVFGTTHKTISFGSALDNNTGPIWIRVVTLAASTGSGSRPTVGIDNVLLSYTNAPTVANPVVIISQPHGATNNAGTGASFTVGVTGTAPIYSWYEILAGVTNQLSDGANPSGDGSTISGSTSATLSLAGIYGGESASYFAVITNSSNATNSAVVKLQVVDPGFSFQPVNITNVVNDLDVFSGTVVGTVPTTLSWYYNGVLITNTTTATLTNTLSTTVTNTTTSTNLPGYYLVAANQFGTVTSTVVTASIIGVGQTELARWDFNDTNAYAPTNPLPSLGTATANAVQNPAVTNFAFAPGDLSDPVVEAGAQNLGWTLSGFPATIDNKTAGFQFNVSTVGYTNIVIAWHERHSATGSKYMRVQYTTNGTDYIDGDVITQTAVAYQFYSSNLSAKPNVNNNPNFGFRIVAEWESTAIGSANAAYDGVSGAFGSGGTIRLDLMTVLANPGTSGPVSSIPLHYTFTSGNTLTFTWSDPSFSLQVAPNVAGPYNTIGVAASGFVTNTTTANQMFFRLSHP
ncbi:MAG TPA: hypothetical protein VG347_01355 [Verrucomicrobiae bacterium]|nr:hypothetical protein [Verrucomicrobiae bacterium]